MTLLAYMKETLESGDPIIRSWAMVDSYYLPFVSSLMYVFFVKRLGPTVMAKRKPFDLRIVMIIYNFLLVLSYVACLLLLCYFFLTTDAYQRICSPTVVTLDNYTYWATRVGWVIYILKYVEFADTLFFVLRKKDHLVTNLHVIHHAVLPIIGWIFLRTETSGFQFIPGGINCFVHIIMYTYYGLAAFGPEVQKYLWWKEYLTMLQMLQFIIILTFVMVIIPLSGCKTSTHGIYIDILFGFLFLALFINFYTKTYKKNLKMNGFVKAENSTVSNGKSTTPKEKDVSEDEEDGKFKWDTFMSEYPVHGPLKRR